MGRAALGICLLFCLGFQGPASAGFRDGLQAYYRLDYRTALSEWQALANRDNPGAQYQLGVMYYRGEGVPQDYDEAVAKVLADEVQALVAEAHAARGARGAARRLGPGRRGRGRRCHPRPVGEQ